MARVVLGVTAAASIGLCAIALPEILTSWQRTHQLPAFTLKNLGVDQFHLSSLFLLAAAGGLASIVAGRGRWLVGAGTVLAFPALILVEMVRDPTSHNLLPFELLFYCVLGVPGLLAAGMLDLVRRVIAARQPRPHPTH